MAFDFSGVIKLTANHEILPFSCSDDEGAIDLNDFLLNDAKLHFTELLSVTYLFEKNNSTAAYFSLLNDKISIEDVDSKSQWKKNFQKGLHQRKKFKSYPAIKIGRLAVNINFQGQGIGNTLLDAIKGWLISDISSGCMYITVDAYKDSLKFYEKNNFRYLSSKDETDDTRLMYYDLSLLLP